jgi:hypothetical protein
MAPCKAEAVAWIVSDGRVLASADVAHTRKDKGRGLAPS